MAKELNKYDSVLKTFCGHNREWSRDPRPHEGYIYATDTYKLIRIEKSKCNLEYEAHEKQPKGFTQIFPQPNCSLTLNIADIEKEITKIPYSEIVKFEEDEYKCEDCHGSKYVKWTYEDESGHEHYNYFKCPVCQGLGYLTEKRIFRNGRDMAINGICYRVGYIVLALETIKSLGHKTAKITHIFDGAKPLKIDVEPGVEILIMPNTSTKPVVSLTLKEK